MTAPNGNRNSRIDGARLSASDPAVDALAYTTGSDLVPGVYSRGVYVDTTGTLVVDMLGTDGITVATRTFKNLVVGVVYPFAIVKVYAASTSSGMLLF